MVSEHPKDSSAATIAAFRKLVPSATMKDTVATLTVANKAGEVRVKRAKSSANQVQVHRGEPLVVHIPADDNDTWLVLPVAWQLSYARLNPITAAQHASHAFDCMAIPSSVFRTAIDAGELQAVTVAGGDETQNAELRTLVESAIESSRDRILRFAIKALVAVRSASANALIETFEEFASAEETGDS